MSATAVLIGGVVSAGVASAEPDPAPLQVSDGPPKVDLGTILGTSPKSTELNIDPNNYAQTCPEVMIVAISGGDDSMSTNNPLDEEARLPLQNWVANLTVATGEANAATPNRIGWLYVPYPSSQGISDSEVATPYQESTAEGIRATNKILDDNKSKCGTETKYVIVGYSIGAEIGERVSVDIGSRPADASVSAGDILGVGLIGDPYRPAGTPSIDIAGPPGGGFMSSEPKDYGALTDKMLWACRPYDASCDAPEDIAILPLVLGVFGQIHVNLGQPAETLSELYAAMSGIATRTVAYIAAHPEFATSDESVLDVLLRESDRTEPRGTPDPEPTTEELNAAAQWAVGPGRGVVSQKVADEATGFLDDNKDLPKLFTEPYLPLGFLQHLSYWNALPGRESEKDKMVQWITDLAAQQDAEDVSAAESPAPTTAAPSVTPTAPQVIPPAAPGFAARPAAPQVTTPDSIDSFLRSWSGPPPEPIRSVP